MEPQPLCEIRMGESIPDMGAKQMWGSFTTISPVCHSVFFIIFNHFLLFDGHESFIYDECFDE
jgi:hypothetical protein